MRVLFWNLGYGRGHTGALGSYLWRSHRFFYHPPKKQRLLLNDVAQVVSDADPQIFSFAELSTGAFHNCRFDQHEYLLEALGDRHTTSLATCKYGGTKVNRLPFYHGNTNGVVSFIDATIDHQYLTSGFKKLLVKTTLPNLTLMTVHLPLSKKLRRLQLEQLALAVNKINTDVIIGGDFNLFFGTKELNAFLATTGLRLADRPLLTYPAVRPSLSLDLFLYRFHDPSITPTTRTVNTTLSDHLPIVLEW